MDQENCHPLKPNIIWWATSTKHHKKK